VAASQLPGAGLGLFATRAFPVGALICRYLGDVLGGRAIHEALARDSYAGGAYRKLDVLDIPEASALFRLRLIKCRQDHHGRAKVAVNG